MCINYEATTKNIANTLGTQIGKVKEKAKGVLNKMKKELNEKIETKEAVTLTRKQKRKITKQEKKIEKKEAAITRHEKKIEKKGNNAAGLQKRIAKKEAAINRHQENIEKIEKTPQKIKTNKKAAPQKMKTDKKQQKKRGKK